MYIIWITHFFLRYRKEGKIISFKIGDRVQGKDLRNYEIPEQKRKRKAKEELGRRKKGRKKREEKIVSLTHKEKRRRERESQENQKPKNKFSGRYPITPFPLLPCTHAYTHTHAIYTSRLEFDSLSSEIQKSLKTTRLEIAHTREKNY